VFAPVKRHKKTVFIKPLKIRSVSVAPDASTVTVDLARPYKGKVEVVAKGIVEAADGAWSAISLSVIVK
jgi:hypothetical protein